MKLSMKVQSVSGQNLKHDAVFAPPPASYEPAATGISQTRWAYVFVSVTI